MNNCETYNIITDINITDNFIMGTNITDKIIKNGE